MRIGIDVSAAQRRHGGISEYVRRLLPAIAALDQIDEFALFSTHDLRPGTVEPLPPLPKNFQLYPLRFPGRILKHSWPLLGWPTATSVLPPVDVFFAPHFLVPPGKFTKLVVTIHDVLFEEHPEWFQAADAKRFAWSVRNAIQRADALIADSEATKHDLIERLGVTESTITTIHLGVAASAAVTEPDWTRAQQHYHLPDTYLLMLGTIEDRKNVSGVLAAYRQLAARRPVPPLVLAGKLGGIDATVKAQLEHWAGPGRVIMTGQFADSDRSAILSHAHLLLFPSLAEGFGLPILEAFAGGVPVLTSTTTSLPEVAGQGALLVDPTDHRAIAQGIEQLLDDQGLRMKLIEAGQKRAHQFTWQKTAESTLNVIKSVAV